MKKNKIGMGKAKKVLDWYGIDTGREKTEKLKAYAELLREKRVWAGLASNACAERPEEAIVESLGVLSAVSFEDDKRVVEIGSGGGLLGVVLAISSPKWEITMVESSARKCAFLAEAIGALYVVNAEVVNARAESIAGEREFDVAVARAAGRLSEMVPLAMGLLVEGGLFVAVKGTDVAREIDAAAPSLADSGGTFRGVTSPGYYNNLGLQQKTLLVVAQKM